MDFPAIRQGFNHKPLKYPPTPAKTARIQGLIAPVLGFQPGLDCRSDHL
jgi:hypothetical protein